MCSFLPLRHLDPKLNIVTSTNSVTATTTAAAAKEAAAVAAATAQSTGTALWNRMRAAKDAINVAITGEERWPGMCAKSKEAPTHKMAWMFVFFSFFLSASAHKHTSFVVYDL